MATEPSWRDFEKRIAWIERTLSPQGVQVRTPDRIVDSVGSAREVDASIRYNVGSVPILIVIECRERQGKEDQQWIEQIVTKKTNLGASEVIAVAAGGLTEPAKRLAAKHNIRVRELREINPAEVAKWCGIQTIEAVLHEWEIKKVHLRAPPGTVLPSPNEAGIVERTDMGLFERKMFRKNSSDKWCSLIDIVQFAIDHMDHIWNDVPGDGAPISVNLHLPFSDGPWEYMETSGVVPVLEIYALVELYHHRAQSKITKAFEYSDGAERKAMQIQTPLRVGGLYLDATITLGNGRGSIELRCDK